MTGSLATMAFAIGATPSRELRLSRHGSLERRSIRNEDEVYTSQPDEGQLMGSFSIGHLLVLIVLLGVPVILALVIWLILRGSGKGRSGVVAETTGTTQPASAEARLQEIAALRSKGLISESEYERKRSEIISGI